MLERCLCVCILATASKLIPYIASNEDVRTAKVVKVHCIIRRKELITPDDRHCVAAAPLEAICIMLPDD